MFCSMGISEKAAAPVTGTNLEDYWYYCASGLSAVKGIGT